MVAAGVARTLRRRRARGDHREAQLVRSVARKLPLRREARVQAVDHAVERAAEALKLRQHVLADLALRQIARLNVFHLRCKTAQRTQRAG